MIRAVKIENWRCIESIEIPLSPSTSLIGPNGSGKSAVLRAIDVLLGNRWPGMANLELPRDFYNLDTSLPMSIRCEFDTPLVYVDMAKNAHEVGFLQYECKSYKRKTSKADAGDLHDDFIPLGVDGKQLMVATSRPQTGRKLEFGPLIRVGTELRDQARVLMISDRRSIAAQASGRRGSVLNSLLSNVRKDFAKDGSGTKADFLTKYEDALSVLRTTAVQEIEEVIGATAKQMLGFLGRGSLSNLNITFGFGDPVNPFGSLMMMCKEGDMILPAEVMGLGIQSAIVVGIFEALRQQQSNIGTVLIEEPEMYLHPQAQRYFHQLLVDMVEATQTQVIYTTHSPIFADMSRFEGIRVFEKSPGASSRVKWISRADDLRYLKAQADRQKLSQYMDPSSSEALFARRVILVEGHGDFLGVNIVARKLGIDLDAEGLSVVPCGGKNSIPFFARMCNSLDIPVLVMHDVDVYEPYESSPPTERQVAENAIAERENQEIDAALANQGALFKISPSLESILGIGKSASDKPRKVADALESMEVADMPVILVEAVKALAKNDDSEGS